MELKAEALTCEVHGHVMHPISFWQVRDLSHLPGILAAQWPPVACSCFTKSESGPLLVVFCNRFLVMFFGSGCFSK